MAYTDYLQAISHTPVTYIEIDLDYCALTFGQTPCVATGEPCYNTFATCNLKNIFQKTTKTYKFSSLTAPLPFKDGERPYVTSVTFLPTEIKDNLTVSGRVTIEMIDEPDTDVGIDPYLAFRTQIQGTYWKKLLARNPNYKGRLVRIYEGFSGLAISEYVQKYICKIDNITYSKGKVKIECVDLLKSLANIEMPEKIDCKLQNDITAQQTTIIVTDISQLDSSGYILIGDEIIQYTGINTQTKELTGCIRGAFGTTISAHSRNDKVGKVKYYPTTNPFDILLSMLSDAGINSSYIDTSAFIYWKNWPSSDINFSAIITEPTKLEKLFFEIVDLIDCKCWIAEDNKITIRRNIPNEPDRSYQYLSDTENVINDSTSLDLNEKSRITRIIIYWDKAPLGKIDEIKSYNRLDIAIDADAESDKEYNEVIEKKIFCRWINPSYLQEEIVQQYIKNLITRQIFRQRNAQPIITLSLTLKDSEIKTGSYIKLTTDELTNWDGSPIQKEIFQVIKRELKGNKITLKLLKMPEAKFGFIALNTTPDYDNAQETDLEYGYITDNTGRINDKPGYFIW